MCVPCDDPGWNELSDVNELPSLLRAEISHFSSVYKDPTRHSEVKGWGDRESDRGGSRRPGTDTGSTAGLLTGQAAPSDAGAAKANSGAFCSASGVPLLFAPQGSAGTSRPRCWGAIRCTGCPRW